MTFRIPRGKHRARPLRFGFYWRRKSFAWVVKFTESCRYDLQNVDQGDSNKLIGIACARGWFRLNTPWWKFRKYHHKDSARFGWRYDTKTEQIEILAYTYVNGRRLTQHVCHCMIGQQYDLHLKVLTTCYYLAVHYKSDVRSIGYAWVNHAHNKKFMYRLGVFFGGNKTAPHDIEIELKKLG